MFHIIKRKTVIAVIFCFLLSVTKVFACDCKIFSIEAEVERSTMIFSGKVLGFEYRKNIPNLFGESPANISDNQTDYETLVVKFQVERWWKGEASPVVYLITNDIKLANGNLRGSSCDYKFDENESYLVFTSGKQNELRTSSCRRTRILTEAEEDLRSLGDGKEPIEN
jgi:hypothetical protein